MKKTPTLIVIALVLLVVLSLVAHHNTKQNKTTPLTRSPLATVPHRIVSLAPNLTEILFELGLGDKIVAVSNDSDYPAETAGKTKIGTFWQPNTEAIIATKPNLIITLDLEQQKTVAQTLNRLGYETLSLKIDTIEELLTAIRAIGTAADTKQRAEELVSDISSKLKNMRLQSNLAKKVKLLWVIQAEPLRVAGRSSFINELIESAGGKNVIGPTISQYPQVGTEQILTCDAEVIIQSAMSGEDIVQKQQAAEAYWSKFTNLPAVKNNRVHVIKSDAVLRLGPRLPQGIELIKQYLHPEQ